MNSLKRFSYSDRLRVDQIDIEKVFSKNESFHGKGLFFLYRKNQLNHPRIVFILSKKKARRANLRNHIKRQGREMIRLNQYDFPSIDIIVLPNKSIKEASKDDLRQCYQRFKKFLIKQ